MNNSTLSSTQLCQTILNQWKQDYQSLHDILNAEQTALESRDFVRLEQSVKDKDTIIKQINAHQLPPMIDSKGISITSMADFKQHCSQHSLLSDSWSSLMTLVEKCCFKNEVNAGLIKQLNQSGKRILNLIKGFDPDNNIYDSSGGRTAIRHYGEPLSA